MLSDINMGCNKGRYKKIDIQSNESRCQANASADVYK